MGFYQVYESVFTRDFSPLWNNLSWVCAIFSTGISWIVDKSGVRAYCFEKCKKGKMALTDASRRRKRPITAACSQRCSLLSLGHHAAAGGRTVDIFGSPEYYSYIYPAWEHLKAALVLIMLTSLFLVHVCRSDKRRYRFRFHYTRNF